MTETYSPKEIAILDAAASLLDGGETAGALKVADIASLAGVGKGTVYEYFSSKDELICKAICRHIRLEIEKEWKHICGNCGFKQGIYSAMDCMLANADRISVWNLRHLQMIDESLLQSMIGEMSLFCREKLQSMYGEMLRRGVAEGLFPAPTSFDYACQALIHLFAGVNFMARMGKREEYELYKDRAYLMLLKTLQ